MGNSEEIFVDSQLKKLYWTGLVPAIAGFALTAVTGRFWQVPAGSAGWRSGVGLVLFVLAVTFAAALPILWRSVFAYRLRNRKGVSESALQRLQRQLILTAIAVPYLALLAYGLQVPRFYAAGSIIAALYAVYYHYPSRKKLHYEKRLFRVN